MALEAEFMLAGRLIFASLFVYNGVKHFTDVEGRVQYASYKGVPAPSALVVATGVMLLLGGLGVAVGAYPVVACGALAVFLIVTTPVIHDFWAVPDEERPSELNHFLKNVGLLGATLFVLSRAGEPWEYALNVGLFQ